MSTTHDSYSFPTSANGSLQKGLLSPNHNITDLNGYLLPSPHNYEECGHGIIGDLSVVDCSVVDSEFVSEYFQNNQDTQERASTISEEEERPYFELEEYERDRLSVLSAESTQKQYSFSSYSYNAYSDNEEDGNKERRSSQYENEPLFPKTDPDRNLLNSILDDIGKLKNKHIYENNVIISPSLNNVDRGYENIQKGANLSAPNINYKTVPSPVYSNHMIAENEPSVQSLPDLCDAKIKPAELGHSRSVDISPMSSDSGATPPRSESSLQDQLEDYAFLTSEC